MSEENNIDKDPMYYRNLIKAYEDIQAKLRDTRLSSEERVKCWKELDSIWEQIRNLNPNLDPRMNYLKSMYLRLISERSRKTGEDNRITEAKMRMGLQLFNEIYQEALIMMKKEENDFFEKCPELKPIETDNEEEDLDLRWKQFRDYYLNKLRIELKKNKYQEQSMETWKRKAMVQYLQLKLNEIYRDAGDLRMKEELAKKFYKKLPKTFKKFRKVLPKR